MAYVTSKISDVELPQCRAEKRAFRSNQRTRSQRYNFIHHTYWTTYSQGSSQKKVKMHPLLMLSSIFLLLSWCLTYTEASIDHGYFNASSVTIPNSVWDILKTKQVTFRTCKDSGNLLFMRESQPSSTSSSFSSSSIQELKLSLHNTSVYFIWSTEAVSYSVHLERSVNDNRWYTVRLKYLKGSLNLELTSSHENLNLDVVVANSTYNPSLLDVRLSGTLVIGENFSGCIYHGPGVNLTIPTLVSQNVIWNACPLSYRVGCGDVDDCWNNPCRNGGSCVDLTNDFRCNCPPNFNGSICEQDLARMYGCTVQPCLNGGTCVTQDQPTADLRQYQCYCREGFEGVNCTEDVNECDNGTVLCGGYPCFNTAGGFTCDCPLGYDGPLCTDINECDSNPCFNDGDCDNEVNSYTCNCKIGFTGSRCETNINDCVDNPCTDAHTRCVDGVNMRTCVCMDGFSGNPPQCSDIDECQQGICVHNVTCENFDGGYVCTCLPGFTGQNCETDINECESVQCHNNASCVNLVNNYTCSCLPGFQGRLCEENINDCPANGCRNGGQCRDLVEDYECECIAGWEGRHCEINTNDCNPDPCQNGGECKDKLNDFDCICPPGYTGPTCNLDINECQPEPCLNGGECFNYIADYSCNCTSDWMGKNCSEVYNECAFEPCLNEGNCSSTLRVHDHTCECVKGFRGKNCEENIDDCIGHNCSVFQRCYDGIDTYTCGCPVGYSGATCEDQIDECENTPCKNNGSCKGGIGEYNCTCIQSYINITKTIGPGGVFLTGYTGDNCEIDIDECQYSDPPICQNDGLCKNSPPGSFTCYCKSEKKLITGHLCEKSTTYCDIETEACANGGTCIELASSAACRCAPGYAGEYCKTNINECKSNPCQFDGNCTDLVNDYLCSCIEGKTGKNCETEVDDCDPEPCMHGQCNDHFNSFTCNCTGTGYEGDRCQNNIDDCDSNSCTHGSDCVDGINLYTCDCQDGYEGTYCEVDINECAATPCFYNSTCLQYSNESLYGIGDPRFVTFSYDRAAGYLCECVDGVKGYNCSEEINECIPDRCVNGASCKDEFNAFFCECTPGYEGPTCASEINECLTFEPCKNGGTCEDGFADYNCTCPPVEASGKNYAGKNCTIYLSGCDGNNPCIHGTCLPLLESEFPERHSYQCQCIPGYTGKNCNKPTVIGFSSGTYISQQVQDLQFDLSLRFRTTLSDALIFLCKFAHDRYVAVSLKDGLISIKYEDSGTVGRSLATSQVMNDTHFHSMRAVLTNNITVILLGESCPDPKDNNCSLTLSYTQTPNTDADLYIGNISVAGLSDVSELTQNYVGCMDDIIFNGNYFIPGESHGKIFDLKAPGCTRKEQCVTDSCHGHGRCEDLWDTYRCYCYRPYFGEFCEKDYTPMTFGKNPDTYAAFRFSPVVMQSNGIVLSFFITTRQENGSILYAGNNAPSDTAGHAFISFRLCNGFLCGDLVKCSKVVQFDTQVVVANGEKHMIEVTVKSTSLTVSINSAQAFSADNIDACDFGTQLFITDVFLGQIPQQVTRKKRSLADLDLSRAKRDTAADGQRIYESILQMEPFEGVLQDVRVGVFKLGVATSDETDVVIPRNSNVTVGAQSTQVVCDTSPCMNGGNCSEVYYNDFSCDCRRGYRGKNCSEPDFCSYGSCPEGSTCENLQDGYECVGPAHFSGSSLLTYKLSGDMPASVVTVHFKTRIRFGAIFYIGSGDYYFKLRIAEGQLELSYKLTPEFSQTLRTRKRQLVNDGQQYLAKLEVINGTQVKLEIYKGETIEDESALVTVDTTYTDFESMLTSGQYLTLGSLMYPVPSSKREANFIGCLEEPRIGGVLLPFFRDDLFQNNTAPVKFIVEYEQGLTIGCQGPDVCATAVCVNGGTCVDTWYEHECTCLNDFDGQMCENKMVDHCSLLPCANQGNCVDGIGTYTCDCAAGFTGDRCQTDLDYCNATNTDFCENLNASCVEETSGFYCNCSQEYTGLYCNVSTRQSCSDGLCQNGGQCENTSITIGAESSIASFNCTCPEPYETPLCEKRKNYCDLQPPPCKKGGVCQELDTPPYYTCDCSHTDYEGQNCTEKINDCEAASCNNGTCYDLNRAHVCNCNPGYTGVNCSVLLINDSCSPGSCQRGQCENGVCNCTGTGYEGPHCQNDTDECEKGVCVHVDNCTNLEGDYNCTCSLGFTGKNCDRPNCTSDICWNGGTCDTNDTNWFCKCPDFYAGDRCDIKGLCADQPCNDSHTERCTQILNPPSYTCHCLTGWEGQNCSANIDECERQTHDCVNGTCVDTPGSFTCDCTPGFKGDKCDEDINECQPDPCMNGGHCMNEVNNYTCDCSRTGYVGRNCTEDDDECERDSSICNNGNCTNIVGSYRCECGTDYLGDHCQSVNPCVNETCSSHGVCHYKNVTASDRYIPMCQCNDQYEGRRCEKAPSSDDDDTKLAIIIGPIVGGVIFIILLILIIAFVMSARSKRATRGAYSPSQQETSGSRVELGNVLKKPPEERLI